MLLPQCIMHYLATMHNYFTFLTVLLEIFLSGEQH